MMIRFLNFFKSNKEAFFWGLLSGALVGTSYIPFPPWALFFCYSPLWIFALNKKRSWQELFLAGWLTQTLLTFIGFHWIAHTAHEFGYLPWPVALLVLTLFATAMHLYIPLALVGAMALNRRLRLSQGASLVVVACMFSLLEHYWPSIFPWNLGYPLLWSQSPLAQWADVVGFSGLSFGIYLLSAWVAWIYLRPRWPKAIFSGLVILGILDLAYVGGLQKQKHWQASSTEQLKVLIAQANIESEDKVAAERGADLRRQISEQYFALTRQGLNTEPDVDLVVWPETAYPAILDDYNRQNYYSAQFYDFSRSIGKPILTGAYSKDPPGLPVREDYNSVFLVGAQGQILGTPYHKTHLLVFGEYMPLGREFPILAKLNPAGSGWGRGTGPTVLPHPRAGLGIQICYESLYPYFSADLATLGAEMIVNVTNDSWFGPRFEPLQHLYMTLARGLETRRPVIRSTNTGISTVMLADGRILEQSPLFKSWQKTYTVAFRKNPPLTFYTRFGSWLPGLVCLILIATLFLGRNRGRIFRSRLD